MTLLNLWDPRTATDGTNVSVTNSAAFGFALSTIVINGASAPSGGSAFQYEADAKVGSTGCGVRYTAAAGQSYMRWSLTGSDYDSARACLAVLFRTPADPSATGTIASFYTDADVLNGSIRIDSGGLVGSYNASTSLISGSTFDLTPGTWYMIEAYSTHGTTTSNGRREMRVLTLTGTVVGTWDSGTTVNAGTAQATRIRLGGALNTAITYWDFGPVRVGSVDSGSWAPLLTLDEPPELVLTSLAPNVVSAVDSTPGSGGTLTYSIAYTSGVDLHAGIVEPVDGVFVIPQDDTGSSTYTVTVTESPSGETSSGTVVVPAATSADSLIWEVWDGSAWVA